jgi:4-amino-4-deoxy-L-arabinose transferase
VATGARWWWVVTLGLLVGLAFQGSRGLYETTEGRYAEVAREMVVGGDWLVPHLDSHAHWTKPPFAYWTMAAGIELLGVNPWGARLANGLGLALLGGLVARLGWLLWEARTGVAAGLILVTSLFPMVTSSVISTDFMLALAEAAVVVAYWQALRAAERGRRQREQRWVVLLWSAAGLAFLVKGPPSLLTPAAILTHALLGHRRSWIVPRLASGWGALGFVVFGLSWYGVVTAREPGLLSYYLGHEVYDRVATTTFDRNPQWYMPFLIYVLPLAVGLGGWLPVVLARAWRRWRGREAATASGPSEQAFLLLWLGLPLLILSLVPSRLIFYIFPFFPVVVLASARLLTRDPYWEHGARIERLALAAAAVLVIAKGVAAWIPSPSDMTRLHGELEPLLQPGDRVVAVDEPRFYGLQFHLQGELERARLQRQQMEAPLLRELLSTRDRQQRLVLVAAAGRPILEEIANFTELEQRVHRRLLTESHQVVILPAAIDAAESVWPRSSGD